MKKDIHIVYTKQFTEWSSMAHAATKVAAKSLCAPSPTFSYQW